MRRPGTSLGRPGESSGFGLWDPWRDMAEMHRRVDDLFSNFFGRGLSQPFMQDWAQPVGGTEPDVDVYDNDKEYLLHAALPGCKPEEIKLEATDDSVMLSCEYRSPFESETAPNEDPNRAQGPTPLRQSRFASAGRYDFSYTFPEEIDPNGIRAEMKNGRLEVSIPKIETPGRGKPISIPIQGQTGRQPQLSQGAKSSLPPEGAAQKQAMAKRAALETKPAKQKSSQPTPPIPSPT
jgi:HSP20 family protein